MGGEPPVVAFYDDRDGLSVPSTGLWVVNLQQQALLPGALYPFSTLYGPMGGEPARRGAVAHHGAALSVPSTGLWVVNLMLQPQRA